MGLLVDMVHPFYIIWSAVYHRPRNRCHRWRSYSRSYGIFTNTTVGITTDSEGHYRLRIPGEGNYFFNIFVTWKQRKLILVDLKM